VFDDQSGVATTIGVQDVTALLHAGSNLIAVKAHDSFGIDEHFSLLVRIDPVVPEPATPVLLLAAIVGASLVARWRDLQEGRRKRTRRAPRGSSR
jgi:hypothetical protein